MFSIRCFFLLEEEVGQISFPAVCSFIVCQFMFSQVQNKYCELSDVYCKSRGSDDIQQKDKINRQIISWTYSDVLKHRKWF